MLLKNRKAKNSNRGLYLQDSELNKTVFQPGKNFKYIVDVKKKRIEIVASDETSKNTVSKREMKKFTKPVIDIRNREALQAFEGCEFLQVEIYEDKILIEGFVEEEASTGIGSKIKSAIDTVSHAIKGTSKVFDINKMQKIRKKASILLSKRQLKNAVGLQQLSFDDFDWGISSSDGNSASSSVADIQSHIGDLSIPLRIASLFSGAGLFDWGFKEEGFEIEFAVEMNEAAASTYRHNLGNHILCADFTESMHLIPDSPVMIMGIPCRPFTNTNRSKKRLLDHPDFILVKKSIEAIQNNEVCSVFVIENVPQMLTAYEGQVLDEILQELPDFEITYGVLSAADMGTAQKRSRAILIGSKIGKIELPEPKLTKENYTTVREAFEGLHDEIPNQLDISRNKPLTIERMKHVPQGGNVHSIPEELKPSSTHSDYHYRLKWDEPSKTIVNPRKVIMTHPEENRILSVRECARLFGLSDNFVFKGTLGEMQQQICNAVPINLSRAVASVVKNAIAMFNLRNRKFAF